MRTLPLLALLLAPATTLAQPIPAPGARTVCTEDLRAVSTRHRTEPDAERDMLARLERMLAARHGAGHPYDIRGASRAGTLRVRCAADQAGGWVCQAEGRLCAPTLALPLCASGTLTVDALGARDMCAAATASGAGISTPSCPAGYGLAEQRGPDACRIR